MHGCVGGKHSHHTFFSIFLGTYVPENIWKLVFSQKNLVLGHKSEGKCFHFIYIKFLNFLSIGWSGSNMTKKLGKSFLCIKEAVQLSDKLPLFNSKFYHEFDGVDIFCPKLTLLA